MEIAMLVYLKPYRSVSIGTIQLFFRRMLLERERDVVKYFTHSVIEPKQLDEFEGNQWEEELL